MKLKMRPHNQPGLLFAFCGLDGCGKSTQIELLREYLGEKSHPVFITKQPTDVVRTSDIFRTYMDQPDHSSYDYRALSLLCASDRVQHTNRIILPELMNGNIVLSDRYFYSCLANLRARNYWHDMWIYDVARFIVKPDCVFFLDVPVELAISRVRDRPQEKNRFIDVELQHRLRMEYIKIAEICGGMVLDNQKEPMETFRAIATAADEAIAMKKRESVSV